MRQDLFALFVVAALAAAGCNESAPGSPGPPDAGTADNGQSDPGQTPAAGEQASSNVEDSAGPGMPLNPQNTKIGFVGTKDDGSHTGGFKEFSGRIELDPSGEQIQRISVEIQTASIWSDSNKLTGHLKNADFFNVNEHPTVTFESTRIEGEGSELTVHGNMTMLGNTQEISFPAQSSVSDGDVTLTSEFKIDRTRFGMTYERGVHHDVTINVAVGTGAEAASDHPSSSRPAR